MEKKMNRKMQFFFFLLSLLGFGFGLFAVAQGNNDLSENLGTALLCWMIFSVPLIIQYAYFKIVKQPTG
tara:strand:- start:305 stop:511 length:207 start_codon:yes stop_codon:yes gene_type:complete